MGAIVSAEVDEVTELMAKIYYRLLTAPSEWWESDEALHLRGKSGEGVFTPAWVELVNWLAVSDEDARKAVTWLAGKEIIRYRPVQNGREINISFAGLYIPYSTE